MVDKNPCQAVKIKTKQIQIQSINYLWPSFNLNYLTKFQFLKIENIEVNKPLNLHYTIDKWQVNQIIHQNSEYQMLTINQIAQLLWMLQLSAIFKLNKNLTRLSKATVCSRIIINWHYLRVKSKQMEHKILQNMEQLQSWMLIKFKSSAKIKPKVVSMKRI